MRWGRHKEAQKAWRSYCSTCGWCLNLRSVSLRFSAYLSVLCVYGCFKRRGRGGTQRTAEKKLNVRHYLFVLLVAYLISRSFRALATASDFECTCSFS